MESPAGVQKTKEVGLKKKKLVRLEGRARKTCFERRRKGLQKKASQLASLCGLRIALVIKDIDDAPDMHTWPPNLDEVQRTVVSDQHRAFDVKACKKKIQVDTCNFASLGSKKNHQGQGKGVQHCGCHLDDLDVVYARKLDALNHRIGVIMMATHTDSLQVTSVPSGSCSVDCCELDESHTDLGLPTACCPAGIVSYNAAWGHDIIPDNLNGDIDATQLMNPMAEAEATTFYSDFGSCSFDWCDVMEPEVTVLDDSCTDLGPPAACSPAGIVAYNAAWGDDAILDDLNGDVIVTQLMNPLAEAEATTFWSDFGSCSATGSNYMELGPEEDFYRWHSSDITEMEEDDLFLQPFSPSSLFDPSALLHNTAMLPQSNSIDY